MVSDDSDENNDADCVIGPTTRRAWSDWCSSRGKSSKESSEEDRHKSQNSSSHSTNNSSRKVWRKKNGNKVCLVHRAF